MIRVDVNPTLLRWARELLDMIYVCEQRQEWYRDFAWDKVHDAV